MTADIWDSFSVDCLKDDIIWSKQNRSWDLCLLELDVAASHSNYIERKEVWIFSFFFGWRGVQDIPQVTDRSLVVCLQWGWQSPYICSMMIFIIVVAWHFICFSFILRSYCLCRYKDASKTSFKSSTRLECMMQDYPKTLPPTARVGFTVISSI